MDSESSSQRRVYNIGGHGTHSQLLDNYDLNTSGANRYDQVFDSQISRQSHDMSQEFSQRNIYEQNLTQTQHVIKKSETEIMKSSHSVHFQTHKPNHLGFAQMKSMGLQVIDENKSSNHGSASKKNKLSVQSVQGQNSTLVMGMGTNSLRQNDLSDVISQSNRLEESVKAPDRLPKKIPGLTNFLCDLRYKKYGTFSRTKKELHKFWKDHISVVYRILNKKQDINGLSRTDINSSTLMNANPALGQSFKSQAYKENFTDEKPEKIYNNLYQQFERLYEMDVVYTLQKDIDEEEEEFRRQKLKTEHEHNQKVELMIRQEEQGHIKWMIEEYYQDLKIYEIKVVEDKSEKLKNDDSPTKNLHHQQSVRDSINPVESIDDDRREPKKPSLSKEEMEKEKAKIEKQIENEQNFMLNLFYKSREEGMTNEPKALFNLYKTLKEKARLGLIWSKGDEDAERVIKNFFKPERFLKRLTIYFNWRNRLGQFKSFSLFGFFKQIKKRQRQLHLIDWKPINYSEQSNVNVNQKKPLDDSTQDGSQLKFEDSKIYSVQEIIHEYESFKKQQADQQKQKELKELEKKQKKYQNKIQQQVFGKEKLLKLEKDFNSKKPEDRINQLAKPKDKWNRGKILMQLRKKFPHDIVLEKMIKEEFKQNRVFKYPEEYDKFDDEEELLCKFRGKTGIETKELGAGKELREKFKVLDDQELYYLKKQVNDQRREDINFEKYVVEKVQKYLEMKKHRLDGQQETLRQYVSSVFIKVTENFKSLVQKRFPHHNYGQKKNTETYKKSYPLSFKKYFFSIVKSFVKTKKGQLKRVRNTPPTFMLAGGMKCQVHDFGCPEDCQLVTKNKKVLLRSTMLKRKQRDPGTYRSRVWRRKDFKDALRKVYMLGSELENCTFEPEAGSMSKNIDAALQANPNLAREGFLSEPDPEAYFNKLGKNFETSHPEVYKAGVLKRAQLKYSQGKYEEAMNALCDGFNIDSLKKHFDPYYMRRFMAEQLLKIKNERLKKEQEESKAKNVNFRNRMQKEAPESQKKRPEEDYENKKLVPVLREAFDLVETMENRKKDAEKQIRQITRSQNQTKKQMRSFSTYKKSQTRLDLSKGEKILFKSIMCPLKDNCSKVKKTRWPTSSTRSITQFGQECAFAHHPMELRFPESIVTKLASSYQTIKNINQRIDEEKPRQVFKPAGGLFDCNGCSQKSGKHIGGPCNLCRYKEMAVEEGKRYTDKKRKNSLMKSIERRESVEVREDKKEMKSIMVALDLDNNYTKKFGILKKSCVLFFYGRFNDAFDEIAKAVKIIQDQKEIEIQKQRVMEKRWRFKLGLDEGFELPIPIESIDPSKVDEKFLKKMDFGGSVALSTLKLYIEQVSPMKNEEYSKHAYLNKCIEDYYLQFESAIEDKQTTIKKMKKQVEKLDEEADFMEAYGSGGASSPERSPDKGDNDGTFKSKPKKTKMCPVLAEKKYCPLAKQSKCQFAHTDYELERMAPGSKMCEKVLKKEKCHLVKEKKCPYAHNPIELDLIPTETKMKNLNGVIMSQSAKLKNMKPIESWKPAKSGNIEHTHLMDMTSKKRKRHGDDDDEDDDQDKKKETKKKSIFERENVFRKPYESQE